MQPKNIIALILLGWAALLVTMQVVPLILIMLLEVSKNHMLDRVADLYVASLEGLGIDGEVDVVWSPREMQESEDRLIESSARPGESRRNTESVHFVFVTVSAPNQAEKKSDDDPDPPGSVFVPVRLDLSEMGSSAGVLVSDSPILWNIVGASPRQRGKIGFEGRAPVDVETSSDGIVAGLRISGGDALRAAESSDLQKNRNNFCKSIWSWSDLFGVDLSRINIWQIRVPAQAAGLELRPAGMTASSGRVRSRGPAARLCEG